MFFPLQLPSAPELLVILLIVLVLVGIPVGVVLLLRRRRPRTEALQDRVDELESQLDATE